MGEKRFDGFKNHDKRCENNGKREKEQSVTHVEETRFSNGGFPISTRVFRVLSTYFFL